MKSLPKSLQKKLEKRKVLNSLRKLPEENNLKDFSSNDYIGFSQNQELAQLANSFLFRNLQNGATGSRLLSGNHYLYAQTETLIARFHQQESALIFNSGYTANIGFFSCVPQREDVVFYDELIHASIRDGLAMGLAKNFNFKHNDLKDLNKKVKRWKKNNTSTIYVVTESVFSMDGDSPDLSALTDLCEDNNLYLIVDEAHALGVYGTNGRGLVQELKLQHKVFAQIVTFGKGLGSHGAAILGSDTLKNYLINFARSLIYTTALPPHTVSLINAGYQQLYQKPDAIQQLKTNISFFNSKISELNLSELFITSDSAIHCCMICSVSKVKEIALKLQRKGFNIKPILSPTVPKGKERLRFCLHSFNTKQEIENLLKLVSEYVKD